MKKSEFCAPCYSRSPAGKAKARETVANALADEEKKVVAIVYADAAPELPAGDER